MTPRYDLLLEAIHTTDLFIVRMFLFALATVAAYPILGWTPAWMRRPARGIYLTLTLGMFLGTVYFSH